LIPKLFKLYRVDLVAWEEFEQTRELLSVKSSIDISKAACLSGRRSGNTRFFLSNGVKKIQRFATSKSLHVPVSKCAVDRISQKNQYFDLRIVFPNPFRCCLMIDVARRAIT